MRWQFKNLLGSISFSYWKVLECYVGKKKFKTLGIGSSSKAFFIDLLVHASCCSLLVFCRLVDVFWKFIGSFLVTFVSPYLKEACR